MITEHFLPIYFPTDGPDIGAMLIFRDVTPSYLKEHFHKWCCIAVAEIDPSRQDEIKAVSHLQTEFIQLIDAVYATAAAMASDHSNKALDELLQQYYDNYYKKDIEREAIPLPTSFYQDFFKEITSESTNAMLWLLVHAVTANKEKYQYELGQAQILNLFHRFTAVVVVAQDWKGDLKKLDGSKKKRSTNFTKKKKRRQK